MAGDLRVLDVDACCVPLDTDALSAEAAGTLAGAFKALGDPVRLRLLNLLITARDGEVCACDLVEPTGKTQPTVSHHLRILKEAGLVSAERRGTNIWYAALPAQLDRLRRVLTLPAGP